MLAIGLLGGIVFFTLIALEQGQWAQVQAATREEALDLAELRLQQVALKPADAVEARVEKVTANGVDYELSSSAELVTTDRYLAKIRVSWKYRDKDFRLERERYVYQEP